jgi:hypothetical protein
MTPLVSALLAATWLAFVSAYFWWRRLVQVARVAKASAKVAPVPTTAFANMALGRGG